MTDTINGKQTKPFVCRYYHDCTWWGLNIDAYDNADAEMRVAKLGNLQLQGELMFTISATKSNSWIPNLICKIGNLFK